MVQKMFHKFLLNSLKVLFLLILFLPFSVFARVLPTSDFYVNDYANILSSDVEEYIQQNSIRLNNVDGTQIVVVTIESLEGESIESYALELFRDFQIGSREKNNGILLLISLNDRKVRVEVGYGLEGILPDGKVGRLLDDYVVPYLRNDDWNSGIKNGYDALYKEIVEKNNLDLSYVRPTKVETKHVDLGKLFFLIFIGIISGFFCATFLDSHKTATKVGVLLIGTAIVFISKYLLSFSAFLHVVCLLLPFEGMYLLTICGFFNLFKFDYSDNSNSRRRRSRSYNSYSSGGYTHRGGGGSSRGGGASRGF